MPLQQSPGRVHVTQVPEDPDDVPPPEPVAAEPVVCAADDEPAAALEDAAATPLADAALEDDAATPPEDAALEDDAEEVLPPLEVEPARPDEDAAAWALVLPERPGHAVHASRAINA